MRKTTHLSDEPKKKYVLFEFISIMVIAVLLVLKTIYWNS